MYIPLITPSQLCTCHIAIPWYNSHGYIQDRLHSISSAPILKSCTYNKNPHLQTIVIMDYDISRVEVLL